MALVAASPPGRDDRGPAGCSVFPVALLGVEGVVGIEGVVWVAADATEVTSPSDDAVANSMLGLRVVPQLCVCSAVYCALGIGDRKAILRSPDAIGGFFPEFCYFRQKLPGGSTDKWGANRPAAVSGDQC